MFSKQLKRRPELLHSSIKTKIYEYIVIFTVIVSSFMMPLIFGIAILDKNEPLNRLFYNLFNRHIEFNLVGAPFMLFSSLAGFKAATNISMIIICLLMHLNFATSWMNLITPLKPKAVKNRHWLITQLGNIEVRNIIKAYRTHQVHNSYFNGIYSSPLFVSHNLFIMSSSIVGGFWVIKLHSSTPLIMTIFALILFIITFIIEYCESVFISWVGEGGINQLAQMRKAFLRRSEYQRIVRSLWEIHVKIAYPMFLVERASFIEFSRTVFDNEINLLLSV